MDQILRSSFRTALTRLAASRYQKDPGELAPLGIRRFCAIDGETGCQFLHGIRVSPGNYMLSLITIHRGQTISTDLFPEEIFNHAEAVATIDRLDAQWQSTKAPKDFAI